MTGNRSHIHPKTPDVNALVKMFNQRSLSYTTPWENVTNGFDLNVVSDIIVGVDEGIREDVKQLLIGLYEQYSMTHLGGVNNNNTTSTDSYSGQSWSERLKKLVDTKITNKNMLAKFCANAEQEPNEIPEYPLAIRLELLRKVMPKKNNVSNTQQAKLYSVIIGTSDDKIRSLLSNPEGEMIPNKHKEKVMTVNQLLEAAQYKTKLICKSKPKERNIRKE